MTAYRTHLLVCAGTGCVSCGAFDVKRALEEEVRRRGLEREILVVATGCNGFCERGPIVLVQPEGVFYQRLTPADVPRLVEEHLIKGRPVTSLMYVPPREREPVPLMKDIEFFKHQRLIVLRNRGRIDPEKIDDYIATDGYAAAAKALSEMTPEGIIAEVSAAGLRGRGGAGYPTGRKWEAARRAPGEPRYIVCNGDEGDPGAFMDRSVLEADPHAVIEGMIIGARAINASRGFLYIRNEYPLALARIGKALDDARDYGLIGRDILGTGFDLDLEVVRGAGAFVSGEETALLASIEGGRAYPRQRPPYPAERGLWGRPTVINNVETWANIPPIIRRGAAWFAGLGTATSKGTKIFSLVGKIANTGLVEVPMGITLREIIFGIGGGILDGGEFKAVQIGGPSGGCIPKSLLDLRRGLREPQVGREHDGLGRHDRHGRDDLHGGHRPLLPAVRRGGILRQVRALPGRHGGHGPPAGQDHGRRRDGRRSGPAGGLGGDRQAGISLRAGPDGAQSHPDDAPLFPRRVRGPRLRQALSGPRLQGPHLLRHRPGVLHRLPALQEGLPGRGHRRVAEEGPHDRSTGLHQVRQVPQRLPAQGPGRPQVDTRSRGCCRLAAGEPDCPGRKHERNG